MNFRNFLALEASLGRRLIRDWREHSMDLLRGIEQAVADGHYQKARDLAMHIDLSEVGEKNKDYIEYMLRSFAVFGAKMANKRVLKTLPQHDQPITNAVTQFLLSLEHVVTVDLQDRIVQSIALAEQKGKGLQLASTFKFNPYHGEDGRFISSGELSDLAKDMPEQFQWLESKAKGFGYESAEHMLKAVPDAFDDLAKEWRKTHQLETSKNDIVLGDLDVAGRIQASTLGRRRWKARKVGVHTLYVCRKLLNTDSVIYWAKQQGFMTTLLPDDLHVTICYSKKPIEWGTTIPEPYVPNLKVSGGKRTVEVLGGEGAVVLHFESLDLQNRWKDFLDAGASWDYDGYNPHLTISYNPPPGMDLGKVAPYTGLLEFGPEEYSPVDSDKVKIEKYNEFHESDGRFGSSSGIFDDKLYTSLDRALIDIKTDRPLNDPSKVQLISKTLPNAEYVVPYSQVPFFNKLNKLQGSDPMKDNIKTYVQSRKDLFSRQPVEKLNMSGLVFTQTVVNSAKIKSNIEEKKDKAAYVVRYKGKNFVMDGHHTIVARAQRGKTNVTANVLDLDAAKKADNGRILTDFVTFGEAGDRMLMLTSGLMSSRVATYGFVAEAEHNNQSRYALSAILDGRTSKFCRMIDGREFDLSTASSKIGTVLSVQDPEDLKTVQPWPDQDDESIAEYEQMSEDELVERGLNIPPFHPYCRTLCVSVEGGEEAPSIGVPDVEDPEVERGQSTVEDFEAVGQQVTEEQLKEWNDMIDTLPNKVLASMFAMSEKQILEAELASGAIAFAADGTLAFNGTLDIAGQKVVVSNILDPYTGKVYMNELSFIGGDPVAASAFMGRILSTMIDQGTSLGMTELVIQTGQNAYQYAQMGFLPQADDWQFIRMKLMDDLDGGSLAVVFNKLDDEQKSLLLNLLSNENEGAMGVLVDLPISVNGLSLGQILLDSIDAEFSLNLLDPAALSRAQQYL